MHLTRLEMPREKIMRLALKDPKSLPEATEEVAELLSEALRMNFKRVSDVFFYNGRDVCIIGQDGKTCDFLLGSSEQNPGQNFELEELGLVVKGDDTARVIHVLQIAYEAMLEKVTSSF